MNQNSNFNIDEEKEIYISIRDIVEVVIYNWKWFILSITASLLVAYVLLKKTPVIYERTASVLIKDEKKSGTISERKAFGELGFMSPANVDNEIHIFRSKKLMNKVVERLQLDINYFHKGML